MKIEELLLFNGNDIDEYNELIKKRERIEKRMTFWTNKMWGEQASIEVFTGELSERDKELLQKHIDEKERAKNNFIKNERKYNEVCEKIAKMQK